MDVKSSTTKDISMVKVLADSPTMSDFSLNKDTIAIGENVSFSGKIVGNGGIIEKVTINIQGPDDRTLAGQYISKSPNSSTFNLSSIPSFKSGATWMKKPGKYWVEVWAKNKDGVGKRVGEIKEVEVIKLISVSGVVRSKYTNDTLEGVSLTLSNLKTTTVKGGKFTFEKVAASSHIVTAEIKGYSLIDENGNTVKQINKYFNETTNQFNLYMVANTGYSITGYVRTPNGDAIPDVEVKPFAPDVKYDSFAVRTDSNGKFTIPEVSAGGHLIIASKEGYAPEKDSYNVQIPSTGEVNIVMNELTKVYGTVYNGNYFDDTTSKDLVLNGATVWLNLDTPEEAGKYVGRTNASGQYNIAGIAPGTHIVHAKYYGYEEKNLNMQFSAKEAPVPYDIIMIAEQHVPSRWAKPIVTNAYNNGLITEKTMYDFRGQVTRLEFCELAVKLYEKLAGGVDKQKIQNTQRFSDYNDENVIKARAVGITSGAKGNKFLPTSAITRKEICIMIYNMLQKLYPGLTSHNSKSMFNDISSISSTDKNAIAFMAKNGIMNGKGKNIFSPNDYASKEEAITVMVRTFEKRNNFSNNIIPIVFVPGTAGVWPAEYYNNILEWNEKKAAELNAIPTSDTEKRFNFKFKYDISMIVANKFNEAKEKKVNLDAKRYVTNCINDKGESYDYYIDPLADTYLGLITNLGKYNYEKDKNFFVFGYDTVETSISKNAKNLDAYIKYVLSVTKASKVKLIAHSQGNLVSRAYIQNFDGYKNIDRFVMVAPPNCGVTKMYGIYYFGSPKTVDISSFDEKKFMADFQDDALIGLRSIMLDDDVSENSKIKFVKEKLLCAKDMLPVGISNFQTDNNNTFLNSLNDRDSQGFKNFLSLGKKVTIIYGDELQTVSFYKNNGILGWKQKSDTIGDGVVTAESATMNGFLFDGTTETGIFNGKKYKESHGGLIDNKNPDSPFNYIIDLLTK